MTTNALARLQQRRFFGGLLQGKIAVFPVKAVQCCVGILQLLERMARAARAIRVQALGKLAVLLPECDGIGVGRQFKDTVTGSQGFSGHRSWHRGGDPSLVRERVMQESIKVRTLLLWRTASLVLVMSALVSVAQADDAGFAAPVNAYLIGVDDQVQVSVWRNPELSVTVPVRPDGMISVPLVGDVLAGGRTPMSVAEAIRGELGAFVRDPNVTVIVTELRSHEYLSRVRVTGAVTSPRSLPYRQGMTVLDAVLEAGGPNQFASAERSRLYRQQDDESTVMKVELDAILKKGDLETNYRLQPGDIITVPERLF